MVATSSEIKDDKVTTSKGNTEEGHLNSSDIEFEKHNEEFLNKVQDFENCLFDKTINAKNKSKRGSKDSPKSSNLIRSSLLPKVTRYLIFAFCSTNEV